MAEDKQDLRIYVIPDLRTWAFPKEYEERSKIEYYSTFEDAKKRFNELRNLPYNFEKALNNDGTPSARLALGVESGTEAFDILHVRAGENYLVDDFTRHKDLPDEIMAVIRKSAAEIGFDKVNSYPRLENGKYGEPILYPFDKWATEHPEYNLTGGRKMEKSTKFELSSISKIENGTNVKALASVVINGELAVRGIKVMEGENGAFVAMPSKKVGGEFTDIAFPVTAEAREALNNAVLDSYNKLLASPDKTLRNELPPAERSNSSIKVSLKEVVNDSKILASGQMTINDSFVVKGVKVMNSEKGAFVSMPSYQTNSGEYSQYSFPITKEMREKVDKAVMGEYQSLGKVEYRGVKYAELGGKDDIAHLPKQNNKFAEKLMGELDKAGVKYQAKIEGMTTISVNKADKAKLDSIKSELVKKLNPEKPKQTEKKDAPAPKRSRR